MNIIRLSRDDTEMLAKWNATKEWANSLGKINEHLINYGFLFNEFKLYIGDKLLFKVEVDKDIFNIKQINLEEHTGEKFIYSFFEFYELLASVIEQREKDENYKTNFKEMQTCFMFDFVSYVVYKAMNQETVLVEETERRYTGTGSKKNTAGKKDIVYSLTDCVRKYSRHINHCKHVYTCEHWEVRGHYRHYKSGKVVYVKPFEKGKNRDTELKDKVYRL